MCKLAVYIHMQAFTLHNPPAFNIFVGEARLVAGVEGNLGFPFMRGTVARNFMVLRLMRYC